MREIKFRVYDKDLRAIIPAAQLILDDGGMVTAIRMMKDKSFHVLAERNLVLVQFTGLKDKNGKEIYEGDITNYGVVEWNDHLGWDSGGSNHPGFYFKGKYLYGEDGELDYHVGFDKDTEVIGNIYEHSPVLDK